MAKFTPGPLVAEIRNKLGNQVFFRNRHGACTRGYTRPHKTRTPPRATTRDRFKAASGAWNTPLTDLDRAGWESLANQLGSRPGPVNGRKWSGRTLWLSCYCNLDNIGVTPFVSPPDEPLSGQLTLLSAACDADAQSLTITASEGDDPPDQGLVILASPPLNPARYTARDLWRQIAAITPNPSFPIELWPDYVAVHPAPTPGKVIILGVAPVAALTGLAGPRLVARCIVSGTGDAMLYASRTITANELKALVATPVTLITAQGANTAIQPLASSATFHPGATPYTIPAGWIYEIALDAAYGFPIQGDAIDLLDQATKATRLHYTLHGMYTYSSAAFTDKPLTVLGYSDTSAELTVGDGTLTIEIWYVLVNTT